MLLTPSDVVVFHSQCKGLVFATQARSRLQDLFDFLRFAVYSFVSPKRKMHSKESEMVIYLGMAVLFSLLLPVGIRQSRANQKRHG